MENPDVTIEVKDVTKAFRVYSDKSHTLKDRVLFRSRNRFNRHQVLKNISFDVERGQAIGLIGHNGCGKSTTLKLLSRILYPDSGSITINGKVSGLIELGAGFHPDMTGRENIYINASIFGLKKEEIDSRIDSIIQFSELEEFIDNPVRTYSSGMYMRLAFSVAINVDADILLIDEILAVGDSNFQRKCFNRLNQIKQNGVTIVIVSHSLDQIKAICNRVIWLEDGVIREDGTPNQVCNHYLNCMEDQAVQRRNREKTKNRTSSAGEPEDKFDPAVTSYQASRLARRIGTMKTRYETVLLTGMDGEEKTSFTIGEGISLKMEIVSDEPEEIGINQIVKIFNRYGGHCVTHESCWQGDCFRKMGSRLSSELVIQDLRIIPGDYFLECAIRNDRGELTDNITHFIEFSVGPKFNTDRDNLGIVNQEFQWNYDDLKDGETSEEEG